MIMDDGTGLALSACHIVISIGYKIPIYTMLQGLASWFLLWYHGQFQASYQCAVIYEYSTPKLVSSRLK